MKAKARRSVNRVPPFTTGRGRFKIKSRGPPCVTTRHSRICLSRAQAFWGQGCSSSATIMTCARGGRAYFPTMPRGPRIADGARREAPTRRGVAPQGRAGDTAALAQLGFSALRIDATILRLPIPRPRASRRGTIQRRADGNRGRLQLSPSSRHASRRRRPSLALGASPSAAPAPTSCSSATSNPI